MASKYRIRKRSSDGTYTTVHYETESSLVLRADEITTVEAALSALDANSHGTNSVTSSAETVSPNFGDVLSLVKAITTNTNGHVTGVVTEAVTIPSLPSVLDYMTGVTSNVQTQLDAKYAAAGGTISGAVTVDSDGSSLTTSYTSLTTYGNILAGLATKTSYSMVGSIRKCASDSSVNCALFFVNSDGTAKFCHKRGDTTSSDDAYMIFDATGFKVAYSGTKGTAASTTYSLLDTNTGYTKTQVDTLLASAGGGADFQVGTTQPTDQSEGDYWAETVS